MTCRGCGAEVPEGRLVCDDCHLTLPQVEVHDLLRGKKPTMIEHAKDVVVIGYTNWKGERRERKILPIADTIRFRETPHHKPAQWVFDAYDVEKPGEPQRTFALASIHSWRPFEQSSSN